MNMAVCDLLFWLESSLMYNRKAVKWLTLGFGHTCELHHKYGSMDGLEVFYADIKAFSLKKKKTKTMIRSGRRLKTAQ